MKEQNQMLYKFPMKRRMAHSIIIDRNNTDGVETSISNRKSMIPKTTNQDFHNSMIFDEIKKHQ